jgi:hypothetical protein
MRLTCFILLTAALCNTGCSAITSLLSKREEVRWPTPQELEGVESVTTNLEGEAALAAAAAIRETIRIWKGRGLFNGCPTPAAGLRATVFSWGGNYYVIVAPRHERCGKGSFYVLDWGESFAVSPAGRLLARHPHGY